MTSFEGLLLGLACMLVPGPVLIETVRRSIRGGARSAVAVQCGALTADLLYAGLFLSAVGQWLLFPGMKFGLGILGAALLIYLGASMTRDWVSLGHKLDAAHRMRRFAS